MSSLNYSKLQRCVLEAADALKDLSNNSSNKVQSTLSIGLYKDELKNLALLLHLAALKIIPNKSIMVDNLPVLINQLSKRFQLFWHDADLLKVDQSIQLKDIENIWKNFNDPKLLSFWDDVSTLGFIYQFFSSPIRKESQDNLQAADKKLTLRRLIAFTQLYTPDWVIDFLLQNTILSRYESGPITILDPACGSGHFLLRTFDLLFDLYTKEGKTKEEAIDLILETNLFGVDIDPVALSVCAFSLMMKTIIEGVDYKKAFKGLACVQDQLEADLLGTLSPKWNQNKDHLLSKKYNIVVTNPPYIGRKLLDRKLKQSLKEHYPDCHQDLCAAFLKKGLDLLSPGGRLGLIGQASMLYLPTYQKLREHLLDNTRLIAVVEAGKGVFPLQGGEKVNSALYVIESAKDNNENTKTSHTLFFDVTDSFDKGEYLKQLSQSEKSKDLYLTNTATLRQHKRCAFNYKCPEIVTRIMSEEQTLSKQADLRQGLATTDNESFVRYKWDVLQEEIGDAWFPYVKGAGSSKWWSPVLQVVDWKDNGHNIKQAVAKAYPYLNGKTAWVVKNEEFYFKEGLTFSLVNTKEFSVRKMSPGCIFDVAGSAIFSQPDKLDFLLGYLNSSIICAYAKLLNPTINFQVGDIKELPVFDFDKNAYEQIANYAQECVSLTKIIDEFGLPMYSTPACVVDILKGKDLDNIWLNYKSNVENAYKKLEQWQWQIDKLVLSAVVQKYKPSLDDQDKLGQWIEQSSNKADASSIIDSNQFARRALWHLLDKVLDGFLLIGNTDDDIAKTLNLSQSAKIWIEKQIEMSLASYFLNEFSKDMNLRFYKSPLHFVLPTEDRSQLLFFSSLLLRKPISNAKLPAYAFNLLKEVQSKISVNKNWTGKQLQVVLGTNQ